MHTTLYCKKMQNYSKKQIKFMPLKFNLIRKLFLARQGYSKNIVVRCKKYNKVSKSDINAFLKKRIFMLTNKGPRYKKLMSLTLKFKKMRKYFLNSMQYKSFIFKKSRFAFALKNKRRFFVWKRLFLKNFHRFMRLRRILKQIIYKRYWKFFKKYRKFKKLKKSVFLLLKPKFKSNVRKKDKALRNLRKTRINKHNIKWLSKHHRIARFWRSHILNKRLGNVKLFINTNVKMISNIKFNNLYILHLFKKPNFQND